MWHSDLKWSMNQTEKCSWIHVIFFLLAEVSLAFSVLLGKNNARCRCIYIDARCTRQDNFSKSNAVEVILHTILSELIMPLLCLQAHEGDRRADGFCPQGACILVCWALRRSINQFLFDLPKIGANWDRDKGWDKWRLYISCVTLKVK